MAEVVMNIWSKSRKESFLYINERSNMRPDWLEYSEVLAGQYKNSIIKPINKYVEKLYIAPKLISIDNNHVILQQNNFAEIFLLLRAGQINLTAMEKAHMRQFYLSNKKIETNNCFNDVYRFFVPWFIDEDNLEIKIKQADNSPFNIEEHTFISKKYYDNVDKIEPEMINVQFKNIGSHMVDKEYGRIRRNSPLYNIEFDASDIIVEKIKEFYVKD
jgi:hypothetical protein